MKIVSLVTLISLDKDGNTVQKAPGVVEVDEETGNTLIKRGQAKSMEDAKADAAADANGPTVKQSNGKPSKTDK
jgi:hypothetical protein